MDAASLDQLVAKVLREELREDENTREQSLELFRDWILKNPDIRDCVTDDSFLLPFLRARKYSVPMAQQTLLKLLKFKQNFPTEHTNLDIEDPEINDVISNGSIFLSPIRERNGEVVSLAIIKNFDLGKHKTETLLRAVVLYIHTLVRNEANQVLGLVSIIDYNQITPAFIAAFPIAVLKALVESFEKAFPLRIKRVHILNLPPVISWFVKLMVSLLSEKLQSRVMFHNSVEELHNHIDPNVLPKEYGGTMPMEEMIGLWKKQMAEHREAVLAVNNIQLVGDSFKNDYGLNDSGNPDAQGSFRKLAVD